MDNILQGKAYVLGSNIDTDQIIPAEHLVYSLSDPEESKKYGHFALSGVPPSQAGLPNGGIPFINGDNFRSQFEIIIAGSNFGCGSSREHAPFALKVAGVQAVIAESYARIFYRNAVDGGFVIPFESSQKLSEKVATGDVITIDYRKNIVRNQANEEEFKLNQLGDVLPIIEAGGLFPYARKTGMIV